MTDPLDAPLRRLELAWLALADERARLLAGSERGDPVGARRASRDDLLRRYAGPLDAEDVHGLLDALDAACARAVTRGAQLEPHR